MVFHVFWRDFRQFSKFNFNQFVCQFSMSYLKQFDDFFNDFCRFNQPKCTQKSSGGSNRITLFGKIQVDRNGRNHSSFVIRHSSFVSKISEGVSSQLVEWSLGSEPKWSWSQVWKVTYQQHFLCFSANRLIKSWSF